MDPKSPPLQVLPVPAGDALRSTRVDSCLISVAALSSAPVRQATANRADHQQASQATSGRQLEPLKSADDPQWRRPTQIEGTF
jgi:hypothetical protein